MHEKITMVITTHMIHQITLEANKEKSAKVSDTKILESFLKNMDKFENNQKIIS
jgi:hypothetical protein